MTNKNKLATGLATLAILSSAYSQKDSSDKIYDAFVKKIQSESKLESETKKSRTQLRTVFEAGKYLGSQDAKYGEITAQIGNRDALFAGFYVKLNSEGFKCQNQASESINNHLTNDQYTTNTRNTYKTKFREQPLELGIKLTKHTGAFDISTSFGLVKTKEWEKENITGTNSTFDSYGIIESKSYKLPETKTKKQLFDDKIFSAEIGYVPIRGIRASIKSEFNLRDKRPEISAKVGLVFGGNKKRK
jgi:hypothetical protein